MNYKKIFILLAMPFFIISCSSSSDDVDIMDDPKQNGGAITYTANIQTIISNNCISCHGSPTSQGAPMSLVTYSQVKNAVDTRSLIIRINLAADPMPQSGLMSQANRDLIQQWLDDGLLQN